MSENIKEIFESFKNRVSSPIFGTFTSSWITCNWKIFLYLFASDIKTSKKVELITERLNLVTKYERLILGPLLLSFVILFVVPLIRNWYLTFSIWIEGMMQEQKIKHEEWLNDRKLFGERSQNVITYSVKEIEEIKNKLNNLSDEIRKKNIQDPNKIAEDIGNINNQISSLCDDLLAFKGIVLHSEAKDLKQYIDNLKSGPKKFKKSWENFINNIKMFL